MEFGNEKQHRCLQVLELRPGASEDEIKKAYKSMALRYHPDKAVTLKNPSPDAKVKFQEISAAYNYLMEGDDYLRRIEHEDENLFDIIVKNLFTWMFSPRPSYSGAFNMSDIYFDDDDDDDDEEEDYYVDPFYRNYSYTFESSRRPQNFMRAPSRNPYAHNLSSPHGFSHHSSTSSGFSSYPGFTFTHANVQHGQYFHETKQAKQHGKSSKRLNKEARMARKQNNETFSGKSQSSSPDDQNRSRATSPFEQSKRQAASPSRHGQRSPTPSETLNRKESKEGSPVIDGESIKTENQSTRKSKKQIKVEQKQREQEMSEIRQQLQEQEEKRKRQSEERRMAQELKEKTEREAKEEERKRDEERFRIEQETARQRMEEEKREKAKKAAETKKRKELLRKFESNQFLNEDGSFQSSDSDLMNIIRTETYSETPSENSENVESINGIPVSELARLQNLAINGHSDERGKQNNDTRQGKEANYTSANQPKTRVRQRSRSRQTQKSATRSELGSGPPPRPNGYTPKSANFNQGNFQQQQHQQPFHQWSQNQMQSTSFVPRPYLHQPCPRVPPYPGPTVAPPLPPPQLNRPPPPLRFNLRPSFPRQSNSNYSAARFPNQPYRMNAM